MQSMVEDLRTDIVELNKVINFLIWHEYNVKL